MSLYCPERLLSTRELTDRARGDGRHLAAIWADVLAVRRSRVAP